MNRQLSVYLDLLRFLAALLVFISHASGFTGGILWQLGGLAHEAVVFFFILSGFVIAYVVFEKQESAFEYSVNRMARIYSVALPALIITVVLFYISQNINGEVYTAITDRLSNPIRMLFSALFFLNQSWVDTTVFSNLPYWSLSYEVLYYIFFGVLLFVKGKKKFLLAILVMIIMGPSILLYLPIWLMGVACFIAINRTTLSRLSSWLLYIVSVLGVAVFSIGFIQEDINGGVRDILGNSVYEWLLPPANKFVNDYVLAIFITMHIFASYHLGERYTIINKFLEVRIRSLSSHTFSLYLYHMPILYFMLSLAHYRTQPVMNFILSWIIVPVLIWKISSFTENRKVYYQKYFAKIINSTIGKARRFANQSH